MAHVAPWWLYPLCMMALFIPTCACAGIYVGSVRTAHSPYPPSTRRAALEARSNGSLSAAQAAPRSLLAARARGLGSSPLATRHASHAIRDAGLRDAIYKFVARHRIWFFGAVETCRRATKEDKKHFL